MKDNKDILNRLNFEFEQLIAIKEDMEGCLPMAYQDKMDTIVGKVENLIYSIHNRKA